MVFGYDKYTNRWKPHPLDAITGTAKMRKWIVRHERDGDNISALWENDNGDRWYVQVVVNGEVQW